MEDFMEDVFTDITTMYKDEESCGIPLPCWGRIGYSVPEIFDICLSSHLFEVKSRSPSKIRNMVFHSLTIKDDNPNLFQTYDIADDSDATDLMLKNYNLLDSNTEQELLEEIELDLHVVNCQDDKDKGHSSDDDSCVLLPRNDSDVTHKSLEKIELDSYTVDCQELEISDAQEDNVDDRHKNEDYSCVVLQKKDDEEKKNSKRQSKKKKKGKTKQEIPVAQFIPHERVPVDSIYAQKNAYTLKFNVPDEPSDFVKQILMNGRHSVQNDSLNKDCVVDFPSLLKQVKELPKPEPNLGKSKFETIFGDALTASSEPINSKTRNGIVSNRGEVESITLGDSTHQRCVIIENIPKNVNREDVKSWLQSFGEVQKMSFEKKGNFLKLKLEIDCDLEWIVDCLQDGSIFDGATEKLKVYIKE